MKVLDLSLKKPAENLALDEALLDWCESGAGEETLRFWESPDYFVVVGYGNKIELETNSNACREMGVPILRRCSGGGTVVQGPGCLNYNLVLNIEQNPELQTIPQTNDFVMNRQKIALQRLLGGDVSVRGHTDLALGPLKFSGNAQRRKRSFLVFHGTFLLDFDLQMISKLLRMPSKEPDYRKNRSHEAFVRNLEIPAEKIKEALKEIWCAKEPLKTVPDSSELVETRYGQPGWNWKF
jgi:lipoate-protein ligase A